MSMRNGVWGGGAGRLALGLVLAGGLAGGCNSCSVGNRTVTVNYTINGQNAAEGCARQGASHVVARARWSSGDNKQDTATGSGACADGKVEVSVGNNGTIQLTAYENDSPGALAMGVSAPTVVTLSGVDVNAPSITVDIVPLRGRLHIHATCARLGGTDGSCTGLVATSGTTGDGGTQAPTVYVLLDTNGFDLETIDTLALELDAADGHFTAETTRARVDASNIVRVTAYTPTGVLLRGESSVRLAGLEAEVEVELDYAVTQVDAGFVRLDGGASSSSSSSSSSSGGSTSNAGTSGTASSTAGSSSVGASSVAGSSSVGASSAAGSSSAGASSVAGSSSAAVSSSDMGASSAAPSSSAEPSSSAAASSSDMGSSAGQSSSDMVSSSSMQSSS